MALKYLKVLHCVTTRVHGREILHTVLDNWVPAENILTLDFFCALRGLEPKFDQSGSLKKNHKEAPIGRHGAPCFKDFYIQKKLEDEKSRSARWQVI